MAKKKAMGDRSDPKQNKSLAIRNVLRKMPKAKAADVAAAVKSEYGHKINPTFVYLVKSKAGVKASRKASGRAKPATKTTTADWVSSIKLAKRLLQSAGSVDNAVAILRAVEG